MGKIDDPLDASFDAWPTDVPDPAKVSRDLALTFAGLTFLPAQVWKILQDQFAAGSRFARIEYLFAGIKMKLKHLEAEFSMADADSRKQLAELKKRLDDPGFHQAVALAAEEAARGAGQRTIERLASIAVGSLNPDPWYGPPRDLSTLIRDVAQLDDTDILVLKELNLAMENVGGPNFNLINAYTERMQDLRDAITRSRLHQDDFYAVCSRLAGFGLALEQDRNVSRMQPHERCFRPTHRGITILSYLEKYSTN